MNKPICFYCKHIKYMSNGRDYSPKSVCKLTRKTDPLGDSFYTKCEIKNKNFQCKDFEASLLKKPFYNKALKGDFYGDC